MSDIVSVINDLAQSIFTAVEENVFDILDSLLNINEEILKQEPLNKLMFESNEQGFGILCFSFVLLFVICFLVRKLIFMYNPTNYVNSAKFILRVIVCTILASFSYYLCEAVLNINGLFTEVICNIGESITNQEISFVDLKQIILQAQENMTDNFISLDGTIRGMLSFGAVSLLFTFATRYVTIIVLLVLAPIALMLAINDSTVEICKKWCKLLISNLFMQNLVNFIIMIPMSVKDIDSVTFKIILVGSMYLLYKINNFTIEIFSEFKIERKIY
ncbi:MAG: hypothetical protein IKV94_00480 [Clostridia bacterium]|nr:hypothetical protein [Clostridia bacterium]